MKRQVALDGIRGVAVIMVLMLHVHVIRGGYIGVDIFFVLSGFLISSILLKEARTTGSFQAKRFYINRARRLVPGLAICIVMTICFAAYDHTLDSAWISILAAATYTANYVKGDSAYLGHTWSLAVEAQFYLLWPFIILFAARLSATKAMAWLLAGMLIILIWRLFLLYQYGGEAIDHTYQGLDTRSDALIAGAIVALATGSGISFDNRVILSIALFITASLAMTVRPGHIWMHGIGFTIVAICAAYTIGHLVTVRDGLLARILCFPILVYIGNISYGLYLYHFPILRFWESHTHLPLTFALIPSFIAAAASWHFIEIPLLRQSSRKGAAAKQGIKAYGTAP